MAYRMRVRRGAMSRLRARGYRSRRGSPILTPTTKRRLRRMAKANVQSIMFRTYSSLSGSTGSNKAFAVPVILGNKSFETGATIRKFRVDWSMLAEQNSSSNNVQIDPRWGIGIFSYKDDESTPVSSTNLYDRLKSHMYFPGKYLPGPNRGTRGFKWIKRKELVFPQLATKYDQNKPVPIVHHLHMVYDHRLKPNYMLGCAIWMVEDNAAATAAVSFSAFTRLTAQSDGGLDDTVEASDVIVAQTGKAGNYTASDYASWNTMGQVSN